MHQPFCSNSNRLFGLSEEAFRDMDTLDAYDQFDVAVSALRARFAPDAAQGKGGKPRKSTSPKLAPGTVSSDGSGSTT